MSPDIAVMTLENITLTNPDLPRLSADPLVRRGTLLLWDFARPAGYPAQADPTPKSGDNNHANETVVNLANSAQMGQLYGASAGDVDAVTFNKGFDLAAIGDQFIVQGPVLSPGAGSVAVIAWARLRNIANQQAFAGLAGQAIGTGGLDPADVPKNSWALHLGGDGISPKFVMWDPTTSDNTNTTFGSGSYAGLHQIGFVFDAVGHTITQYVDGAQVAQTGVSAAWGGLRTPQLALGMGNWRSTPAQAGLRAVLHRLLVENLTTSKRTGKELVEADWAANQGRFA